MPNAEGSGLEPVRCGLCGADDFRVLFDSPRRDHSAAEDFAASTDRFDRYGRIVRCRACGLVYANPRPAAESVLEGYAGSVDTEYAQEAASRSINAHLSLHTIKRFASKGSLLDIGCSTGYFLNAARLDFAVRGIEPSSWAARYARDTLKLDIDERPLGSDALSPGSFDVVTMIDVVEHFADPLAALRRVHELLKPGGLLYLVTPDIESLSARLLRGKWWGLRPAHLYYFSEKTLAAMLEKAGFETMLASSYGRMFTYDYWKSRLQNYPGWLRRAGHFAARLFGTGDKFLYLNTRDSLQICARRKP